MKQAHELEIVYVLWAEAKKISDLKQVSSGKKCSTSLGGGEASCLNLTGLRPEDQERDLLTLWQNHSVPETETIQGPVKEKKERRGKKMWRR